MVKSGANERIEVHATCVAVDGVGVLLQGPSGSGKSDLALRLMEGGARLVADDRATLSLSAGRLTARAPAGIAGRMEVRGLGIVDVETQESAAVGLVVELASSEAIERLPMPRAIAFLGIDVPVLRLAAREASAPAKVRLAVRTLSGGIMPPR
jgi:HPr kinase/phosphorylase